MSSTRSPLPTVAENPPDRVQRGKVRRREEGGEGGGGGGGTPRNAFESVTTGTWTREANKGAGDRDAENAIVVCPVGAPLNKMRRGVLSFLFQAAGGSTSHASSSSSNSGRRFSRSHHGDEVYIGNYKLIKTIGKGNFAKVKLARHVLTGVEVFLRFFEVVRVYRMV